MFPNDGLEFELVPGSRGVFDVDLNGQRVYSKHDEGGFPRYGEVPKRFIHVM